MPRPWCCNGRRIGNGDFLGRAAETNAARQSFSSWRLRVLARTYPASPHVVSREVIACEDAKTPRKSGNWGVADILVAKAHLDAHGVRQDGDIQHIPGLVKLLTFYDPDGNAMMLSENLAQAGG
jgi:hypothetical protein